ncbi:hypothetical protein VOLCADRAFT_119466 [Volvox carteri f. nagariensis]|uniref:GFO/IDH/MocA-like oxidoreductase domain-containing protein n=1 Tax=Volvox carteri f. nagariensis TaxID=3068 RepID=D8UDA5_VOLCA|nr:uncharacterized protein VOLCADRAFT_119466 [Volvox carteri f. nagariensis]EFJ42235.1 hypothetical protein VOLCADRAFT_119466 [Volvox carteri f. nagariensis]|eukprot:XP_002956633.1 hypothetical protein VOLCADRAFT_119466 [Volvox carteri f. nagariensis]
MAPLGAALLGTGIFAKDIYKNNFKSKEGELELKAVWSRTIESAQAYVHEYFPKSKVMAGEEGLQHILDDDSIHLVVVVLPVQVCLQVRLRGSVRSLKTHRQRQTEMHIRARIGTDNRTIVDEQLKTLNTDRDSPACAPQTHPSCRVVERCLAAGKAVVQEKPVAATVEGALRAIASYRRAVGEAVDPQRTPLWMFAENYRYESVFVAASRRVSELGKIIKLDLIADLPMDERNRYYGSTWRRDTGGCPGGFFMDSSVHFVAALRLLARAAGLGEAVSATAHARQVIVVEVEAKADLVPPDTVVGVALFATGEVPASISISLAAHQVRWSLSVVGTEGSLEVSRGGWGGSRTGYTLSVKTARPAPGSQEEEAAAGQQQQQQQADPTVQIMPYAFSGCQDEFSEFVGLTRELRGAGGGGGTAAAAASGEPNGVGASGTVPDAVARSSPEEGARDLALIEALLASAAAGGRPVEVVQI